MWKEERRPNPDCPNCGIKEGACMGMSEWGHDIPCCSDECGKAIKRKLKKNESRPEYKRALKGFWALEELILSMRYKDVGAEDPFFKLL
jgi:hypothetical protein